MFRNSLIRNTRGTAPFHREKFYEKQLDNSRNANSTSTNTNSHQHHNTSIRQHSSNTFASRQRLDDMFDDVATSVPGFGGMYLDGNTLKVYLIDPAQKV